MTRVEKIIITVLLIGALSAIIIGMITGPLGYVNSSLGSSVSALLISACLFIYCMMIWKK